MGNIDGLCEAAGSDDAIFENNTLDDFTYNKALQKIMESHRVDPETKQMIRSMKRKTKRSVRV